MKVMEASDIYKCIADPQRLRILNLLEIGPLCVCHIQELLKETQVKTSKQLAYMKQLGLVGSRRESNWMIYALTEPTHGLLKANISYLLEADCDECNQLQIDRIRRGELVLRLKESPNEITEIISIATSCC